MREGERGDLGEKNKNCRRGEGEGWGEGKGRGGSGANNCPDPTARGPGGMPVWLDSLPPGPLAVGCDGGGRRRLRALTWISFLPP